MLFIILNNNIKIQTAIIITYFAWVANIIESCFYNKYFYIRKIIIK